VTSRKADKEALRREREARERQASQERRRKQLVGYGVGAVLALAAVFVIALLVLGGDDEGGAKGGGDLLPGGGEVAGQKLTDPKRAASAAGCELKSQRAKSRDHTTDPSQSVDYPDDPPMAGRHYEIPAEDGAYNQAPRDEELVHTMEHGRVIVWFKPNLPEASRAKLKALFDEDEYQIVLVPRRSMSAQVAATAWNRDPTPLGTGRLMTCSKVDDATIDALRTFRDEHRSNGPEPIP
jgi:hypothetical protein